MTSAPLEPTPGVGGQAEATSDLGVGGPADEAGPPDAPSSPPGYPEEVDPAAGPLAERSESSLGDLRRPGPRD